VDNKPENHSASNQNELDLGLNQVEPITPKKSFEPNSSSFLNKFFGKKNAPQNNPFAERKEPTFGTATTTNTAAVNYTTEGVFNQPAQAVAKSFTSTKETVAEELDSTSDSEAAKVESAVENSREKTEELFEETLQETEQSTEEAVAVAKPNMKNPENWAIMQKLPQKHRRLFIAITGAVAVLIALVLLKPSSDTVEDFQASNNGNNMPIEFQSLDPNQPIENADMANTVQPVEPPVVAETNPTTHTEPATTAQNSAPMVEPAMPAESTPAVMPPASNMPTTASVPAESAVDTKASQVAQEQQAKAAAEKAHQEQLLREQQAKARAEKLKAEQQAKARAEKLKAAQEKARAEKLAAEKVRAQTALNGAPVSEAKPASSKATTTTKAAAGTNKTLTVPASTSLFQVFRSNGLDIRDVNAMTKANGVGNALSNFKAGDKVQVSTNSEGRVSRMRLSDGSVFTRQADGSYKYSK